MRVKENTRMRRNKKKLEEKQREKKKIGRKEEKKEKKWARVVRNKLFYLNML